MPVAGQTIDFEKKHYNLENDVARFVSLTKAIELEGNQRGKYYVLGQEPQRTTDQKNHQLFGISEQQIPSLAPQLKKMVTNRTTKCLDSWSVQLDCTHQRYFRRLWTKHIPHIK